MVLVNVKVTEDVKAKLDGLKLESESYTYLIDRLIKENAELKADNERLFTICSNLSEKV